MVARTELPADLVANAQRGNRQAQTQVLQRYAAPLQHLVRRLAPGLDVEAVTQGLFEHVLRALPKFEPTGAASLTTWVFSLAHHFVIDELRRKRLTVVPLDSAERLPGDERTSPEHAFSRTEAREALERAIARLPDDQRRVLVLVHLHEQSLEAAAQVEGVPVGTVKSRLFRAKARLAAELGPRFAPVGATE